jgi:alkanesulfonate monooxygenase SsuD/methylene tetrahydromethanopterin reductase-like flavin-dependent oxidoreductase (luciferase family)
MWSIRWATEQVPRDLAAGLARAGRTRPDIHVNLWFWAAPNRDPRAAVEDARATVAFYAGIAQYEPYFAAHGFAAEARRLQPFVQRGDYRAAARLVPDEMARTFVLCGTPDEVRRALEPAWAVADSMCLAPPHWGLGQEQTIGYAGAIAETFYGG